MADPVDLTGSWSGHYVHLGDRWPITAQLWQVGHRLTGTMADLRTETDSGAKAAGVPPDFERRFRARFPDAPPGPIRIVAEWPPAADLDGAISGGLIRLRKQYRGPQTIGYRVGTWRWTKSMPGHAVRYRGRLGADGSEIVGRWSIRRRGWLGWLYPPVEGDFRLRRDRREAD